MQIQPVRLERMPSGMTPELGLLLACAHPEAGRARLLEAALACPLEWDRVLRLADYHRLLPALYAAFRDRVDVPASILSAVGARFDNHQRRVLRFSAELARILRQFEQSGIQTLAHKGAALGQFLYNDPAQRQFGDLDFLVRASDVARARLALQALGYVPKLRLSPRQEKEYLRTGYEHVFGLGCEPNLVEVQWQVLPRFYAIDFEMETLFKRAVELDIDGLRLRTLAKEDQMLVLCVHAAKHGWAQLGMLRDIAMLSRMDLDWQWIKAESARLGVAKIVAVSLQLASGLLACDTGSLALPQEEIDRVAEIVSAIETQIALGVETDTESLGYFRNFVQLREGRRDRARTAWRLVTTPSIGEWQAVRLPDSLFSLYRGVRLFRLAKRFCLPAAKRRVLPVE